MTVAKLKTNAENGSMHIAVSGEIDLANAAAVEDELREAVSQQPTTVSVDLTDLTYLDSAGIRILFTMASGSRSCGSCWNSSCRSTRPPAGSSNSRGLSHLPRCGPEVTDRIPADTGAR
jgi:ABC-type transporter Mla MlaB component